MVNKKIYVFVFLLSILFIQNVTAITTNFNISTLREETLKLEFYSIGEGIPTLYGSYNLKSPNGKISFKFTNNADKFVLNVFLMDDLEVKLHERFTDIKAGKNYKLIFTPIEQSLIEINKTDESIHKAITKNVSTNKEIFNLNKTEETNKTIKKLSKDNNFSLITGNTIFEKSIINTWVFYAIVLIVFLVVILFAYFKVKNSSKKPVQENEIKIKKLSELRKERQEYAQTKQERIDELEAKIKELQNELIAIKKSNQIAVLQEKLKQDQEALAKAEKEK